MKSDSQKPQYYACMDDVNCMYNMCICSQIICLLDFSPQKYTIMDDDDCDESVVEEKNNVFFPFVYSFVPSVR